jgi:negative regulator of flagellin synthesis FlgM
MVIDFSRLNNSPPSTGGVRGNAAPGNVDKTGSQQ